MEAAVFAVDAAAASLQHFIIEALNLPAEVAYFV